ncbi:MAG: carboxypeptidase-like regulatory domain-containing protein, partial [Prevotellaceae bacterium]|nr:carboxypeptidase-like regulatory domain-containing protein [Prevotellaceae bacterium]
MMKNILIFIIANLLFFSCLAQANRKIFVADSLTREPIEYASIVFVDTAGGTYSNAKGFFSVPNNIKQIELSSIGYNTKTMIL